MSTPVKDRAWKNRHADVCSAEKKALAAMAAALPVGRRVYYKQGENPILVEVLWVSTWGYHHADVGVRNNSTGKEYRVSAYRIMVEL